MGVVRGMSKRVAGGAIALGLAVLVMAGCGGGSSSSSSDKVTATPTFSPGGGTYNTSQTVTIADTTSGAVLYCTTDGTAPTTSSPKCAQPTTVFQTEFLQAIAVAPGKSASPVAAAAYTIDLSAAATPTFSPAGGSYTSAQQVTIASATSGANIYYTADGTVPTASSTLYTGPITVSSSQTLSAIAVASGHTNSGVASATYVISQSVAAPVFSVPTGNYTSAQTVTITDATPNATIYYAINSSTPSASSTQYTGPITVSQTETISAIAIVSGSSSPITTVAYTITTAQPVPVPTFSPASGSTVTVGQTVTIADGDANAIIHYTIDGSTPTSSSSTYTGPIALSTPGPATINAIAIDAGTSSTVATATYTVIAAGVAAPTFSPASGSTVTAGQTVTITDSDASATIYYTIDGSAPTSGSSKYTAPVALSTPGPATIKAIAIDAGTSSTVATATYTVSAAGPQLSGKVMSGTKPVNGAQVQLYAAGQSGYGSNATALGSAAATDSSGAFTVSYSCPASPGDLVYLVATGGDTGSGANSALEMMTALGPCGGLTSASTVVVNEVTTVASAYALSAFMTTAPNVGSSSTNYQGLSSAFGTANNLVDITTGNALTITPAYKANPVVYLNTSTVPQARIDTLANILNACADSNGAGGGCSNLFSAATPVSGTAPANTLQAILDIAQNPGKNVSSLFGLTSATAPFQSVLASAPGDWTLALTFTGAGLGLQVMPNPASAPAVINTSMAIDATGNIWVTAYGDSSPTSSSFGNSVGTLLAKFNNLGAPVTQATKLSAASPGATLGGFQPESGASIALNAITIDQAGNLWLGDGPGGNLFEVSSSLSVLLTPQALGQVVQGMAIDSSGNVWASRQGSVFELQNNGTQILSSDGVGSVNVFGYGILLNLTFDANGGLWGTDSLTLFGTPDIYQISTSDGTITYDPFLYSGIGNTTLATDSQGNIYGCGEPGGQTLDVFNSGAIANTYPIASGRGCGTQLVLDGQGHLFAILNSGGGNPAGKTIDEFTTSGVAISPANGYTGTSSGESPTLNPDPNIFGSVPGTGAVIDGSGNLWVLNSDTNGSSSPGNVLVEFVGIAAPVVTPTSVALQNGQLGVRP